MRRTWALGISLLFVAPVGALWTNHGGDPGHSGVMPPLPAPLDVLASYSFLEPGEHLDVTGMSAVVTPHGLAAIAVAEGTEVGSSAAECTYVLVRDPLIGSRVDRLATMPCPFGGFDGGVVGGALKELFASWGGPAKEPVP